MSADIVVVAGINLGHHGTTFITPVYGFDRCRVPAPADGAETIGAAQVMVCARFCTMAGSCNEGGITTSRRQVQIEAEKQF